MISVVIPAHNAAHTLDECLRAIGSSTHSDYEVIVVDDASADATVEVATQRGCRVLRCGENVGAARAKNLGAGQACGDIVFFTDADVVVQPDTLERVAAHFVDAATDAVVGLLGQRLRHQNFASQFKNLWMYYTYTRLARSRAAGGGVGLFFTSVAAIRREVFQQMDGFDPHYRGASVTEDIEFGQRLLTAGHKIVLNGQLAVEHLKYYSLAGLLRTDLLRAFGLAKTWLRKRLERDQRAKGAKYYASVPWFFVLGVPLSWLLSLFILLTLWTQQLFWLAMTTGTYVAILLANAPFLKALHQARGWVFGLQSGLFLPLDLWVSGLGALWALLDYGRGNHY